MVKNKSIYSLTNVFSKTNMPTLFTTLYLIIGLLFLLPTFCRANTETWELRQEKNGIRIDQQATKSGYAITRGIMEMKTSVEALLMLMRDRSTCRHWVFACKEGRLIEQYNPEQRLDYTVIDSPLWFADRDMYIHTSTQFDSKAKTVVIQLSGRENHDKGKVGRVRLKNLQGLWHLQQTAPDKVKVLYQIYSNPQLMASPLLDAYMVNSVFHTLKNMDKVIQEVRYRQGKIPELK
jgi:hypothetical protein